MSWAMREKAVTSCMIQTALLMCLSGLGARAAQEASEDTLAPVLAELAKSRKIVFAVREDGKNGHWYANFGHWSVRPDVKMYGKHGKLCVLDVRDGSVTTLLDDAEGGVRDPCVHYDGDTILFSYRPGGTEHYHLYEIRANGTGLRQLTDGPYDDIEATYLPDWRIMFCSSRCKRWVPCHWVEVATLHTCDRDGSNMQLISANPDQENSPWPLPDGRIIYTRWEYVDRSVSLFHHLWTTNPDGTNQMVYFGNMHPGNVFIDAKPIPGTDQVVFANNPGHGQREHAGRICIVDPQQGPDAQDQIRTISRDADYRDPWPVGRVGFLAGRGDRIVIMDYQGRERTLYQLPPDTPGFAVCCQEPRPLAPRARERVIPSRVDPTQATGRVVLTDIYRGRNMAGVQRGDIAKLLVLPKSLNASYGPEPITSRLTYNLERILGTVPVEEDGSAYAALPARRTLFFVALDRDDRPVKRMNSYLTVQPGEVLGCVGCHEHRVEAPRDTQRHTLSALQRPVSTIEPIPDIPDVIDFPRDIQPVLDRHCVACHDYTPSPRGGPRSGGVVLCGDRGPLYSHS